MGKIRVIPLVALLVGMLGLGICGFLQESEWVRGENNFVSVLVLSVLAMASLIGIFAGMWLVLAGAFPEGKERKWNIPGLGLVLIMPLVGAILSLVLQSAGENGPLFVVRILVHALVVPMLVWGVIFCIYDVFTRNEEIKGKGMRQWFWVIVLLVGGVIAFPIYWFVYFRKISQSPQIE